LKRRKGSVLLLATLSLPVLFGMLALSVDLGFAYAHQRAAQSAADAAARAAVKAAMAHPGGLGSAFVQSGTATCPSSLPATAATNFDHACAYAAANGISGNRVQLEGGTTSPAPTVPGLSVSYWVTARVSFPAPALFGHLLGGTELASSARATAAAVGGGSSTDCVIALDPSLPRALQAGNNARVNASCGVRVNSSATGGYAYPANTALWATGSARITAPTVQVVGGSQTDNNGSISPTPVTSAPAAADPLLDRAIPDYSGMPCLSGSFTSNSWQTGGILNINPGRYCGGLTFANNSRANFAPGMYFVDGGSMTFASGMTFVGTGVTFFLVGSGTPASLQIGNGVTVDLAAPTSGDYQGMLFFQKHAIPPAARTPSATNRLQGGANMKLVGTLYFRDSAVQIDNGTSTTSAFALIANTLNFQGGTSVTIGGTPSQTGLISPPTFAMIE